LIYFVSKDGGKTWAYDPSMDISAPSLENKILENTTGDTYSSYEDGTIVFSYENGKFKSTLSLKINLNRRGGFYVSSYKTAAAYIAQDNKSIQIVIVTIWVKHGKIQLQFYHPRIITALQAAV
jgi:hypothetical protein